MKRFWLILAFLLLAVSCQAGGSFKPTRATATPSGDLSNQVTLVSFADLDADPAAYLDQLVRVSGELVFLEKELCSRWRGPRPAWALIDQVGEEVMRLDAVGYEDLVRRVPAGTVLTVDGFWRLYEGPLGCGKEPADGFAWYLDVTRLVQPNPLPLTGGGGPGSPRVTPIGGEEGLLTVTPTPSATGTRPASPTPSRTPSPSATPTAGTPEGVTPTASPTPGITPTPSQTPTSGPGQPTATPSRTPTSAPGQPTPTRTPTSPPAEPTSTPSGYPAPSPPPGGYP